MNLKVAISTVADGNMAVHPDLSNKTEVVQNRAAFLATQNITTKNTSRVKIVYQGDDYCRYHEVDSHQKGGGMFGSDIVTADGLITRQPGHALFLPLADCVGVVIFDPNHHILMLSHVGRHSLEQNGGHRSVKFLIDNYQCDPAELLVWLTPAPGRANYPLFAFENRDFKAVIYQQLESAGITTGHITNDPTDTTQDKRYFSHSEFLRGNRTIDGRYAVVVMMEA